MKREERDAWAEALEQYPHGQKYLINNKGCYCALGVLGAIRLPEKLRAQPADLDYAVFGAYGIGDPMIAIGLSYEDTEHIALLNDSGATIKELQDYIRSLPVED